MYNFKLINADTDSILVSKQDNSEFSVDEQKKLLTELNSLYTDNIRFEEDGVFHTVIVVKAKNYVLWDGKKLKIKGSSLKATTKAPALKEFIQKIIWSIINNENNYLQIYNSYVKEILDVKDINRWAKKVTVTDKVLDPRRPNEQKVFDALEDLEDGAMEGDKVYMFYRPDNTLSLVSEFNGEYNKTRLLKNLYDTAMCFSTIIDKSIFLNYALKRNTEKLKDL